MQKDIRSFFASSSSSSSSSSFREGCKANKGANCSVNGKRYEEKVLGIARNLRYMQTNDNNDNNDNKDNNNLFCNLFSTAGSTRTYDVVCMMITTKIPIEAKIKNAPDWGQVSLKRDIHSSSYISTNAIVNEYIRDQTLFNNHMPPIHGMKTYEEWKTFKNNCGGLFNDMYFDCRSDTIRRFYTAKGVFYIQISELGLYHLGNDICRFQCPIFDCKQRIRVRIKVHSRSPLRLSVMASCQPQCINDLPQSPFSLDSFDRLPDNLKKAD